MAAAMSEPKKSRLTLWICAAIVLAIGSALAFPHAAMKLQVGGEIFLRLRAGEVVADDGNDQRIKHFNYLAADGFVAPADCFEDFRRYVGFAVIHRGMRREVENLPNILTQNTSPPGSLHEAGRTTPSTCRHRLHGRRR